MFGTRWFLVQVGLLQGHSWSLILFVDQGPGPWIGPEDLRGSGLGTSECQLSFLRMMWFWWCLQTRTWSRTLCWDHSSEPYLRVQGVQGWTQRLNTLSNEGVAPVWFIGPFWSQLSLESFTFTTKTCSLVWKMINLFKAVYVVHPLILTNQKQEDVSEEAGLIKTNT